MRAHLATWRTLAAAVVIAVLVLGLASGLTPVAGATPQMAEADRLSPQDIAAKLTEAGYPHIHSIELEHGRYEVMVRNQKGRKLILFVDPETGKANLKAFGWVRLSGGSYLSVHDLVVKVRAAGFAEIYAVDREHALYEIVARTVEGGLVKLYAHPKTGGLIRSAKTNKPLTRKVEPASLAGPPTPVESVLAKIEKAGMSDVYAVYPEHNMYEFIARDKDGQLILRHIDPKTGEIFDHP